MKRSGTLPSLNGSFQKSHSQKRVAKANYGYFREKLIQLAPPNLLCRIGCRGPEKCKYCSPSHQWPKEDQALRGIYSHWVTDNICAMARPTQMTLRNHDLVHQFRENGIASIVNLQKGGEHQACCPNPMASDGFSYNPEEFMQNEVFHYNFGWPDFGISSLELLVDMVKVVSFASREGAIAVHCHAGLGRTGVLIAAFLVWERGISAGEAISYLRSKRKNSVQTRDQITTVYQFAEMLLPLKRVFPPLKMMSYEEVMNRQSWVLHGLESRVLKSLPKVVFVICERLLELAGLSPAGTLDSKLHQLSFGDELFYQHILEFNQRRESSPVNPVLIPFHKATSMVDMLHGSLGPPPSIPRVGKLPPIETSSEDTSWSLAETAIVSELPSLHQEVLPPICACDYDESGIKRRPDFPWAQLVASCKTDLRYDTEESSIFGTVGHFVRNLKHKRESWEQISLERNSEALMLTLQTWFLSFKEAPLSKSNILSSFEIPDDLSHSFVPHERVLITYLCRSFAPFCEGKSSLIEETVALIGEWLFRADDNNVRNFLRPQLHILPSVGHES